MFLIDQWKEAKTPKKASKKKVRKAEWEFGGGSKEAGDGR